MKLADKATEEDIEAATSDTKWVTPKGANPLNSFAPGDIIFSGRDIEKETNGKWALCDGREYLASAKPKLFAAIGNLYGAPLSLEYLFQKQYITMVNDNYFNVLAKEVYYASDGSFYMVCYQPSFTNYSNTYCYYLTYVGPNGSTSLNLGETYESSFTMSSGQTLRRNFKFIFDDTLYAVSIANIKIYKYGTLQKTIEFSANDEKALSSGSYMSIACAFQYNGAVYIVYHTAHLFKNSSVPIYLVKINNNESYTMSNIASPYYSGEPTYVYGTQFNYSTNTIYIDGRWSYNMETGSFLTESEYSKEQFPNTTVYIDNGKKLLTSAGIFNLNIFAYDKTFSISTLNTIIFKMGNYYNLISVGSPSGGTMAANGKRVSVNYNGESNEQQDVAISDMFTVSERNDMIGSTYTAPILYGAMNLDGIKYIPIVSKMSEYSEGAYKIYKGMATLKINRDRFLLPVSTYDEKNTRNSYMKTE